MKCDENRRSFMRNYWLIFLSFSLIFATACEETVEEETVIEDFFICRTCGNDVSVANLVLDNYTPLALGSANHTIFGNKKVLIQEVQHPLGIRYKIILVKQAYCMKTQSVLWAPQHYWFPDYAFKVCLCPKCHKHIGWMFEPNESATDELEFPSEAGFYALIYTNIISEGYVNSLLMTEKSLREN